MLEKPDNFTLESLLNISYNEYIKERDKWEAPGIIKKGARRIMYNPYNGKYEYWKKGDDALLKLTESTSFKEAEEKYERDDDQREQELLGTFGRTWNSKGQAPSDTALYAGQGNDGQGYRSSDEAGQKADALRSGAANSGRNNEGTLQGIKADERLTEGGALSDVQNSTIRGLEDYFLSEASPEELEDIKSEVDHRMALQDDRIMCLRELIYRTLFSYVARTLDFRSA